MIVKTIKASEGKQWELEMGVPANECPVGQRDPEVQPVSLPPHELLNA
jgi:hypothetical protein